MLEGQITGIITRDHSLVVAHSVLVISDLILSLVSLQVSGDGFQSLAGLEHLHVLSVDGMAIINIDAKGLASIIAIHSSGGSADQKENSAH
jgi:hypothetical protein